MIISILRRFLFLTGISFILSSEGITGAFIGTAQIASINTFIGLILILVSLFLQELKGKKLEDILHEMESQAIPKFQDVKSGIEHTKCGEIFRVGNSFYMHVPSKTEAANIAKKLVGEKAKTLWCYGYLKGDYYLKTRLTSTDEDVLREEYHKLAEEGMVHYRFAKKSIGFAVGEQTTGTGGRTWERYARFDKPSRDLPFKHYNVGGRYFKGKDLHLLICTNK